MRRSPLRASLVASAAVFLAALLAVIFQHNTINGRTLTVLEQLPMAAVAATLICALALLGTWLGLRGAGARNANYLTGLVVASVYISATVLANWLIQVEPQTFTVPSREAAIAGLKALAFATAWGIGGPFLIALVVGRLKVGSSPTLK